MNEHTVDKYIIIHILYDLVKSQGGTVQGQTLHVLDIQNAMPPL